MTFGGFTLGSLLLAVGFLVVYKTNWFEQNMGDLGAMFGAYDKPWMSWKVFGVFLMALGFLIAFGILPLFFQATIGQLFLSGRR